MKTTYQQTTKISNWAEDDRPREKLINKGPNQLSNAELLAILLGSGTKSKSALDLSREIFKSYNNNLRRFSKASSMELQQFNGIGQAKAVGVVAALELARRCSAFSDENESLSSAKAVFKIMGPLVEALQVEQFWILLLNNSNELIKKVQLSEGGITGTVVDQRILFKHAFEAHATGIILCHNHPSGNLEPSQQDLNLTKKLAGSGKFLDLPIVDHLILSDKGYFSFADEGLL